MSPITDHTVDRILQAIRSSGQVLIERQQAARAEYKSDQTVVTPADREIGERLATVLHEELPGINLAVEDYDAPTGRAEGANLFGFVDPVDGTGPYARGFAHFAISVALFEHSERVWPHLAVVHLPAMRRWYVARPNHGQLLLHSGDCLASLQSTQPPTFEPDWESGRAYIWASSDGHRFLSGYQGKIRALGASALHLAMLTDGTYDPAAVLLSRYKFHDIAAGLVIAESAGMIAWDIERREESPLRAVYSNASDSRPLIIGSMATVRHLAAVLRS